MTRLTWPAIGMAAAMIVLFAGAFADLPTWRRDWPAAASPAADPLPPAPAPAQPQSRTPPEQTSETLQRQARDLQTRIEQETKDLAAVRASADRARGELASIQQQRQAEQAALTRADARQHDESDSAGASPRPRPAVGPSTGSVADPAAIVAPTAKDGGRGASSATSPDHLLAVRRLVAARSALASGRGARARWLLTLARSQMSLWPMVTESRQGSPMIAVATAITLLNRGDRDGAARSIDQALAATEGNAAASTERNDQASNDR